MQYVCTNDTVHHPQVLGALMFTTLSYELVWSVSPYCIIYDAIFTGTLTYRLLIAVVCLY